MKQSGTAKLHISFFSTRAIFAVLLALSLIVFAIAMYNIANVSHTFDTLQRQELYRDECSAAIEQLREGSDILTNSVNAFSSTCDPRYLAEYWNEVETGRMREGALEKLVQLQVPPDILKLAQDAATESNRLMGREIRAMRLVCESIGMPEYEMPQAVADYLLPEEDMRLGPVMQRQKALDELYGSNYYSQKKLILSGIDAFSKRINERNTALVHETSKQLSVQVHLSILCTSFVLLLFFTALLLCYRFIFLPVASYTKRISTWDRDLSELTLPPQGMRELRAFATGFNALSANLRRTQTALRLNNEQYRVVALQSNRYIFRYDIAKKVLEKSAVTSGRLRFMERLEEVPESSIERGAVAPGSHMAYRALFSAMDNGEETGGAIVNLRVRSTGEWRWFSASFTTIFDDQHRPIHGVMTLEDITEQREKEIAYEKWQREIDALKTQNSAILEYNLTRGILEKQVETTNPMIVFDGERLNEQLAQLAMYVNENEREAFVRTFNREHLLGAYYGGRTEVSLDFRISTAKGELWHNARIQMVPYPVTDEIKAYVILKDIDAKRRSELAVLDRAQLDSLTGVFNRSTFIEAMEKILRQFQSDSHALLMIDLDGFKHINDTLGHTEGDNMLLHVAKQLKETLRAGDLLGRIGGDEFLICLKSISTEVAIRPRIDALCRQICTPMENGHTVTASIGVAIFPRDGDTFDILYRRADMAMYHAKNGGRNRVAFFTPDMLSAPDEGH